MKLRLAGHLDPVKQCLFLHSSDAENCIGIERKICAMRMKKGKKNLHKQK